MKKTWTHPSHCHQRLERLVFTHCLTWVLGSWLCVTSMAAHAGPLVSIESPIGFFTNVASRLLQSQLGLSLNHIQVYPTNQYTPSVHRLLQVTANLYDAATNRAATDYPYLPSVFRPVFAAEPPGVGSEVYICGFEEVTNTDVLSQPVADLSDPGARANLGPDVMVCGIPLLIGVKKGFPNFNKLTMQMQVQVARKLQFHRPGTSTTLPVNEIDQMFVVGISNAFGVEAWNSYSTPFPRNLVLVAQPDFSVVLTNLETGKWINSTSARYQPPVTVTNITANTWLGYNATFPRYSFQIPVSANWVVLTNSTYSWALDQFVPQTGTFERTAGMTNLYVPHWQLSMRTRLRFAMVDAEANRIVDYVNLDSTANPLDITAALTKGGVCGTTYIPDGSNGGMWCTNRFNGATSDYVPTFGIQNQIETSMGHTLADWNASTHDFPAGMSVSDAIALFKGQFQPGYLRSSNTFNTPFQPFRNIYLVTSWQANDPLVHYVLSDLTDLVHTNVMVDQLNPPPTPLGQVNIRYEPWGGNPYGSSSTPTKLDLTVKDPMILRSDNWDFPTNLLGDLTGLGRVHRGTPWQTLYFKSPGTSFINWMYWTGNNQLVTNWNGVNGPAWDAFFTQPTNDWHFASLLVSLLSTNDPRHLASVNQPSAAAWLGLLDGMTVLTNTGRGLFTQVVMSSNSPQAVIVAAALDAARASRSGQHFLDPADILTTPALSLASPWLDTNGTPSLQTGPNDAAYEAIASQLLPLLRPDSWASVSQAGGTVQIEFRGADGYAYTVQTSSNLLDWSPVSTNYPSNGSFNFVDVLSPASPRRFYRSILLP